MPLLLIKFFKPMESAGLYLIKSNLSQKKYASWMHSTEPLFPSTLRREGMMNDMQQLTNIPIYPIEKISIPTLVIHAANDPIIPFESGEFSAQTIPNARFLRLADGGHFACIMHKEETVPIVQDFLNRYNN